MHFHYITYGHAIAQEPLLPDGHESYNFRGPFLGHHYFIISLSDLFLEVKKKFFKEIMLMQFHYVTYIATP